MKQIDKTIAGLCQPDTAEQPTHGQMRRNTDLSMMDCFKGLLAIAIAFGVAALGVWAVYKLIVAIFALTVAAVNL